MSRRSIGGIAIVVVLASIAAALLWWHPSRSSIHFRDQIGSPNVVLILVDTLRADHTSIGGYHRDTTPGLQRIAAEGVKFDSHFANAPWTKPSIATILTGLLPGAHGAQWGDNDLSANRKVDVLSQSFQTFPEMLRKHGYRTHAFMTNIALTSSLGYAQGFDEYVILDPTLSGDQLAIEKTKRALDRATGPTFIWCHLMAVHGYVAPPDPGAFDSQGKTPINMQAHYGSTLIRRYDQTYHEGAIDSYDNTVLFADRLLEDLTSFIRGNHPDTLVIITSDHGEEFLEHGGYLHARTLYNEILRVPLVLMGPGIPRGQSVSRLTDHTDLFATVLDYLGLPPSATQGESLLRKPHGKGALIYAEKRNGLSAMRTLISEEGKFIEQKPEVKGRTKPPMAGNGRWSFYRDPTGPDHLNEISSLSRARLIQAREEFQRISDRNKSILEKHAAGSRIQREMTDEELEALRALGYAE